MIYPYADSYQFHNIKPKDEELLIKISELSISAAINRDSEIEEQFSIQDEIDKIGLELLIKSERLNPHYEHAICKRVKFILYSIDKLYFEPPALYIHRDFAPPQAALSTLCTKIQNELYSFFKLLPCEIEVRAIPFQNQTEYHSEHSQKESEFFYSCNMCQVLKPTHICILTHERDGMCGELSYADLELLQNINPHSSFHKFNRGELLDPQNGIYAGVNRHVREYTYGAIENVALYSSNNPMPISPLAQLLTMHDPVADRIIVLDRRDSTKTPDGFNFEELYQMVREVKQADGFTGHAISELHSPSFMQGDGGRAAVSWYSPTLAPFF